MDEFRLYTIDEVTQILKISQRTLYVYIKNKSLKAVKVGKDWRIRKHDLQDLIEHGTIHHI